MEQRINIDINRDLWRQLSIRCAELDLLKKDAVEQAIGDWLKKTEEGEMSDLRWEETTYSEDGKDFPAVYIYWGDVREFLGEDHTGDDPAQDQKLVDGLLDAGAPGWVKDAPGWVDEKGWGLYHVEEITYTLHDRIGDSYKELTEEQAQAIMDEAGLHTGPYGAMGSSIDQVVYEEAEDEITVRAIRYDGRWLEVPRSQNPFISSELGNSSYEEPRDADD